MKRTESVLVGLVCAVLALLFAYLCVYGSIFTSTIAEKHYTVETIVQVQDQPLFSLLGLLVACGILWLFSKVEGKIPLRAMVIFSLVWAALLGTLWVLAVRRNPGGRGRDRGRSPSGHESELYGAEAKRRLH
ncbi:MAG: hypothetical protein ACLUE8_00240 [Lachnospiraceae bacterium]